MVNTDAVNAVSDVIGWMYFLAWSASFYPQSFINYKNKNVGGFSLEFALLNPSGFFFYSVYSVAGRVNGNLGTGDVSFLSNSSTDVSNTNELFRFLTKTWSLLCTPSHSHPCNLLRSSCTIVEIREPSASSGSSF